MATNSNKISTVVVVLLLSQFANCDIFVDPSFSLSDLQLPVAKSDNVVVELLIVCDVEFSQMFQFNRTSIVEYFKALLWDVHMRFQTLQSLKISFQVNEIILLQNVDQQPFVELVRENDSNVSAREVLYLFSKWIYNVKIYHNYDIAIAAISGNQNRLWDGAAYQNGACLVSFGTYAIKSVIAVVMRASHPAKTMAHEIAHILGAHHDDEVSFSSNNCGLYDSTAHGYIMANSTTVISRHFYFFSNCSDSAISRFVQSSQARSCLKDKANYPFTPIFATADFFRGMESPVREKISIERQCQLTFQDNSAFVLANETRCLVSICRHNSTNVKELALWPMGGTPCNNNTGICFRGDCLPPGGHLQNVGSKNCLNNSNSPLSQQNPTLTDCNTVGNTPLDLIHFQKKGENEIIVYTIFSTADGSETFKQCLGTSESGENASFQFQRCMSQHYVTESSQNLWEVVPLSSHLYFEGNGEFLLKHKDTQLCLMSVPNSKALEAATCSESNESMKWLIFVNGAKISNLNGLHNFIEENEYYVTPKWVEYLLTGLGLVGVYYVDKAIWSFLRKFWRFVCRYFRV